MARREHGLHKITATGTCRKLTTKTNVMNRLVRIETWVDLDELVRTHTK
jgi:hypothetical protein